MNVAGHKPRFFLRLGTWSGAVLIASSLAACGGGGGSSGGGITPPVNPPTSVPTSIAATPTPTAAPTATPTPAPVVTVAAVPSTGTTATIASVGGYTGSVAIPAPATGAGAKVTITAATAPLLGIPTLQSALRRPQGFTGAPGLLYISLISDGTLTFTGYPTISIALPASAAVSAGQLFYLAVFSSDNFAAGYVGPIASSAVAMAGGANTLTFTSAFNSGFTLTKGTTYEFVVFTIATTQGTPTPSASPAPTATAASTAMPTTSASASPVATVSPAATTTPTATATPKATATPAPSATPAPTASPSSSASTAPAPAVGVLASNGLNSFIGHLGNSTNVTIVGVGGTYVDTNYSANLGSGNISAAVSTLGALSARRATRSFAPNPLWLNGAWNQEPFHLDTHIEDGRSRRTMRASLTRVAPGRVTQSIRRTKGLPTAYGATQGIWVNSSAIGTNTSTYNAVPSTLRAITTNGYIWVDNTLTNLTQAQIDQIGVDFENAYTSDVAHFGSPNYTPTAAGNQGNYFSTCDSTGATVAGVTSTGFIAQPDTKIAVEILDPVNIGAGTGGYFSATNYYPQAVANCIPVNGVKGIVKSNESAMFYVAYYGANAGGGYTDARALSEDVPRGTAHEFQHLINFVRHEVLQTGNGTNGQGYSALGEESWVDEGMSVLAQDFALSSLYSSQGLTNDVGNAMRLARSYLAAPQNFSITAFTGKDTTSIKYNCGGCYGASYMFQRYMYDHFGGDTYLKTSLNNLSVGQTGIEQYSLKPLASVMTDFGIALAASNTGASTAPAYNFTGLNLRNTYTDQMGSSVTLTGPGILNSIAPSSFTNVSPYFGSVFFLNGTTIGTANVTLTDTGGTFGLRVGVVQQ